MWFINKGNGKTLAQRQCFQGRLWFFKVTKGLHVFQRNDISKRQHTPTSMQTVGRSKHLSVHIKTFVNIQEIRRHLLWINEHKYALASNCLTASYIMTLTLLRYRCSSFAVKKLYLHCFLKIIPNRILREKAFFSLGIVSYDLIS